MRWANWHRKGSSTVARWYLANSFVWAIHGQNLQSHFLQISLLPLFCLEHHRRWNPCWPTCQELWHPRALWDVSDARKELQESREAYAHLRQCSRLRPLQTSYPYMAGHPDRQRGQVSSPSSLRCCSTEPFRMCHPAARRRSPGWSRQFAARMVYACRSKLRVEWLQEGIYVRKQARE